MVPIPCKKYSLQVTQPSLWQTPPLQMPEQHSLDWKQLLPTGEHAGTQAPNWQFFEQQSPPNEHAWSRPLHALHTPPLHVRPAQQPWPHENPAPEQDVHTSLSQKPLQQSVDFRHCSPPSAHMPIEPPAPPAPLEDDEDSPPPPEVEEALPPSSSSSSGRLLLFEPHDTSATSMLPRKSAKTQP
jgi:hypothetical protein